MDLRDTSPVSAHISSPIHNKLLPADPSLQDYTRVIIYDEGKASNTTILTSRSNKDKIMDLRDTSPDTANTHIVNVCLPLQISSPHPPTARRIYVSDTYKI